jgi:hypothetical protein
MKVDKAMAQMLRELPVRSLTRAAKAGIAYDLPDSYASVLYERQQGRCDVTGLPFSMEQASTAFVKHPFAPSLDRRDSQGGYTVDNVRLVYACVNFGMGQWGQEVYLHCARAAVEHDRAMQVDVEHAAAPSLEKGVKEPLTVSEWYARQRDRVDAAEVIAKSLTGDDLSRQKRHIASLKRNFTLGQKGLSRAAKRAAGNRAVRRDRSQG